jgi:photosystem II stability/assembly factor-like uncharacterized protein
MSIRNASETIDATAVVVGLYDDGEETVLTRTDIPARGTVVVQFAWMPDAVGMHSLKGVVDPHTEFIDHNHHDNFFAIDVAVANATPPGADLVLSALEVPATPDLSVVPRATFTNSGPNSVAAPFVFRATDASGMPVFSYVAIAGPIPPGGSVSIDVPWPADSPLEAFSGIINPRFRVSELNSINNVIIRNPPPSDLYVTEVSIYQLKGQEFPLPVISFRVVNGGSNVVGAFRTKVLNVEEGFFEEVVTNGLAAGAAVYVSVSLPTDIIKGGANETDISIEADSDHVVSETDETNNVGVAHFRWLPPDEHRWVSIGPKLMVPGNGGATGVLNAIAVAPLPSVPGNEIIMYVAAAAYGIGPSQCGIWRSLDSGATWQPVGDSFPISRIDALAIPPTNHSHVYAVATSGAVFKSADMGTSWKQISTEASQTAGRDGGAFFVHPTNPSRLFLTCGDGVRRSIDGGATWQLVLGTGTATPATGLVMDPSNPNHLVAALLGTGIPTATGCGVVLSTPNGLYESYDGGDTWCHVIPCSGSDPFPNISDVGRIGLAVSGSKLFASFKEAQDWTLFHTTDVACSIGGSLRRQWHRGWVALTCPQSNPQCDSEAKRGWSGLYADPVDSNFVYRGGTDLYVSDDGGDSFHAPNVPAHADHHGFATDPRDHRTVYTVGDGGVYRSTDQGMTWTQTGAGITNTEFYDIADAPSAPNTVIGGTQDNASVSYDGSSTVWQDLGCCGGTCDGDAVDVDPFNSQTRYIMGQGTNELCKSINGGSFAGFGNGLPARNQSGSHERFQVHPLIPATVVFPAVKLYRTTSGAPPGSWSALDIDASNDIRRSAIDGSANLYYAGATNGSIHAGVNGANWKVVFNHPMSAMVTDIEVNLDDPSRVYVAFAGNNTGRVYRMSRPTMNLGSAWTMAFADITSNLPPSEIVQSLAVDRNAPFVVYAGTAETVYRGQSVDGGVDWNWTPYRYGLPSAIDIRELEVHPTTGVIRAGTVGRGAYEILTGPAIGSVLSAEGRVVLHRVNDVGTGYGPPGDAIDGEVIVQLDTWPGKAFGFQLRNNAEKARRRGMLNTLRTAFNNDFRVRLDYIRSGIHNGTIIRVVDIR